MELTPDVIFTLIRSEKEFPVDFDDAWQWIGYTQKKNALRKLKKHFDEHTDYVIHDENGENNFALPFGKASHGGHNK